MKTNCDAHNEMGLDAGCMMRQGVDLIAPIATFTGCSFYEVHFSCAVLPVHMAQADGGSASKATYISISQGKWSRSKVTLPMASKSHPGHTLRVALTVPGHSFTIHSLHWGCETGPGPACKIKFELC